MKEAKKETQRIRAYRALLEAGQRGVSNGEFIHRSELRLGSTYRTRVSELREEMKDKFGAHPDGDWIPGKEVGRDDDGTIWRWHLLIPPDADARDPLGLLNLELLQKKFDKSSRTDKNEGEQLDLLTRQTGGDHGQDEVRETTHQEEAGNAAGSSCSG